MRNQQALGGTMRVLVVASVYTSGHGNWLAEQVRSLRLAGVDVEVIFFDPRETRLNYGLSFPRIVHAVGSKQYDIIHVHHTYTMLLVDMAKRLTNVKTPTVFTNHEPETLDVNGRTRTWHPTSRLRHSLLLKRFAAKRADSLIVVCRQLADVLRVEGAFEVIPCGVDLTKFKPLDRAECRTQLGMDSNSLVIFFPANPKKPFKRFALAQEVHKLVQRELRDAALVTGGSIDADTMPLYYNAADVVLQTSFCEASPTVVKEALACEIPVVSTDAGDTRDVIRGVPNCYMCSEDPGELADRVLLAGGHRATGARDHLVRQELGLSQIAERVIHVYEHVLGG